MSGKTVFATVGTTKFDKLVSTLTQKRTLTALRNRGFNNLIIQIGNGSIIPDTEQIDITVSYYTFKPSILEDILKADFVISHAGAGSCIQILSAKKPLLVVVNEDLSDNHQLELANQFSFENYVITCYCSTLIETIEKMDLGKLRELLPPDPSLFSKYMDKFMGFSEVMR